MLSRREFCVLAGGVLGMATAPRSLSGFTATRLIDVDAIDRGRVLLAAAGYLKEKPITITSASCRAVPAADTIISPKAITGGRIQKILEARTFAAMA